MREDWNRKGNGMRNNCKGSCHEEVDGSCNDEEVKSMTSLTKNDISLDYLNK